MSLLHYACHHIKDKTVEILLCHPHIDVNATDRWNDTPLIKTLKYRDHCNSESYVNIVQQLLDHPLIIINQNNNNDDTKNPIKIMQYRLDYFEKHRNYYLHPLDEEAFQGYIKVMHLLKEFLIKRRYQSYCYHFKKITDV